MYTYEPSSDVWTYLLPANPIMRYGAKLLAGYNGKLYSVLGQGQTHDYATRESN